MTHPDGHNDRDVNELHESHYMIGTVFWGCPDEEEYYTTHGRLRNLLDYIDLDEYWSFATSGLRLAEYLAMRERSLWFCIEAEAWINYAEHVIPPHGMQGLFDDLLYGSLHAWLYPGEEEYYLKHGRPWDFEAYMTLTEFGIFRASEMTVQDFLAILRPGMSLLELTLRTAPHLLIYWGFDYFDEFFHDYFAGYVSGHSGQYRSGYHNGALNGHPDRTFNEHIDIYFGSVDFNNLPYVNSEAWLPYEESMLFLIEPLSTAPTVHMVAAVTSYSTAALTASINNPSNVTITHRGFTVQRSNQAQPRERLISGTNPTFIYDVTGLTPNSTYFVQAFARNANTGARWLSPLRTITTPPRTTTPGAPHTLSATPEAGGRAELRWSAPVNNGGGAIIRYDVAFNNGGWTQAQSSTRHLFTNLPPGTHTLRVRAVNSAGLGPQASIGVTIQPTPSPTPSPVIPPSEPRNPRATSTGASQLYVNWTAPANPGSAGILRYEISHNYGSWINVGLNTSRLFSSLSAGTHTFRIRAVSAAGNGAIAHTWGTVQVPVTLPALTLAAIPASAITHNSVGLSGTITNNGNAAITFRGFWIRPTTTQQHTEYPATSATNPFTRTITGLIYNTTYLVRAAARNTGSSFNTGTSAYQQFTTRTTTPGIPRSLGASGAVGQATFNWAAPASTGGAAITRYEVSRDNINWVTSQTRYSHTFTGVPPGTHTLRVRAVNSAGNGLQGTINVTVPTATPSPTPAPTLVLTPSGDWNPSAAASFRDISVTSNTTWAVPTSNVVWLTVTNVTPANRTGNGAFRINVAANTGTVARSGTVTVAAPGVPNRVVNVTQAAVATPAPTPTVTITLNPNGGTVNPTSVTRQVGQLFFPLPTPTRAGHTFTGWLLPGGQGPFVQEDFGQGLSNRMSEIEEEYDLDDTWVYIDMHFIDDIQPDGDIQPNMAIQPFTLYDMVTEDMTVGGGVTLRAGWTPIITEPGMPRNLDYVVGYGQVSISWLRPLSDGGSPITGFQVSVNNGTWVNADTMNGHTFKNLLPGTHSLRVRAVNNIGVGLPASTTAVVLRGSGLIPSRGILVTVLNGAGQPIEGAIVQLLRKYGETHFVSTDINGTAYFANPRDGDYGINVTHWFYASTAFTTYPLPPNQTSRPGPFRRNANSLALQTITIVMNELNSTFRSLGWGPMTTNVGTVDNPNLRISSVFGWRGWGARPHNVHGGIDLVGRTWSDMTLGRPLLVPFPSFPELPVQYRATIEEVRNQPIGLVGSGGLGLVIRQLDADTRDEFFVRYLHMQYVPGYRTLFPWRGGTDIRLDQEVVMGQVVGFIGDTAWEGTIANPTARSSPHLHVDVHRNFDPSGGREGWYHQINPSAFYHHDIFVPWYADNGEGRIRHRIHQYYVIIN